MPAALLLAAENRLLAELPLLERQRLLLHCEEVQLSFGEVICEAGAPMHHLYFPLDGFISQVFSLGHHRPLELGLIGNEGVLGATQALDVSTAPSRAVVQGSGRALRISVRQLRFALRDCPRLLRALKRYLYVLMTQLMRNAACGHFHEVEPRLARWLLMTQDCAHAEQLQLTHAYLADMLGVRRSGVSIAAGDLQSRQLIHYRRGQIAILDRAGLELVACECYAATRADYARLFAPAIRS
ncbi:Crp-like helix-turn-helix domain protein [compost metagenome]